MITATRYALGTERTERTIRLFRLIEIAAFAAAALVHYRMLVHGYDHPFAPFAESLIPAILLVGFAVIWVWPAQARPLLSRSWSLLVWLPQAPDDP